MFREVMQHNTIVDLPLIALILFIVVFASVVIRVLLKGRHNATYQYMANMPLDDGDAPAGEPSGRDADPDDAGTDGPTPTRGGTDHG